MASEHDAVMGTQARARRDTDSESFTLANLDAFDFTALARALVQELLESPGTVLCFRHGSDGRAVLSRVPTQKDGP